MDCWSDTGMGISKELQSTALRKRSSQNNAVLFSRPSLTVHNKDMEDWIAREHWAAI